MFEPCRNQSGLQSAGVLSAKIAFREKYPNPKAKAAFYSIVLDRLSKLPGVRSVGMVLRSSAKRSSIVAVFQAEGAGRSQTWPKM